MDLLQSEDRAYFKTEANGRITCTLNGHTFPALEEPIRAFTNGTRYRRLRVVAEEEAKLKQYEPLLVQSRNFPDKLFCSLTCHIVNKSKSSVEKHMLGKKYRKAQELHARGEHDLMEEPDLESSEEDASIVVTKTRCAGGDESDGMELGSTGGQEAGMDVDAPVCVEAGAAPDAQAIKAAAAQNGKFNRMRPTRPKRIRRR